MCDDKLSAARGLAVAIAICALFYAGCYLLWKGTH